MSIFRQYNLKYISIGSFSVTEVLVLIIWICQIRGWVFPAGKHFKEDFLPFLASSMVSIPFGFLLLIRELDREDPRPIAFSLPKALFSVVFFFAGITLRFNNYIVPSHLLITTGIISGLFVCVPLRTFIQRIRQRKRLFAIGCIAASASFFYNVFDYYLFERLCQSTAVFIYWVLHPLGMEIGANVSDGQNVTLFSSHYLLKVYRPCSGIEGMFLFQFLLSSIILADWPLFKRLRFPELYFIGFIYMFVINALRIGSLFVLAYFAWQPDASGYLQSLRGTPLDVFHSFVGEIYYFIAFIGFAFVLYKRCLRTVK